MVIERIVPGTLEWDAYYANHISRYQFATDHLKQFEIGNLLDAACGVGYGSQFLAKVFAGAKVTGVDRSKEALSIANKYFKKGEVNFIEDDCHTLKAASAFGPFDAIVSFETLEHLPRPNDFLSSCYANLKERGSFIVSTPNQLVSSPGGNLNWEFHEKEYKAEEVIQMLGLAGFKNIELYGQRFTQIGKFRKQIRAGLHTIHSNPFVRVGRWIQSITKKHTFSSVLPEQQEDFEIVKYTDLTDLDKEGINGPFVVIAICEK